jgi:hypothetical protein
MRVVTPAQGASVSLPLRVNWVVGRTAGNATRFAVFVDRSPMPPGHDLAWLARGDESCRRSSSCPDETWLNNHGVYTTSSSATTVRAVPSSVLGDRKRADGGHRVVVVRVDSAGRRVGEQVAARLFFVAGR